MRRLFFLLVALAAWAMTFPALASSGGSGLTPAAALQRLQEGNARFRSGMSAHPNQDAARRLVTTSLGQKPFATVLACSDSRVPVEILFDQGIGDLFVIKVAGNVADTDEIGSMEYGVDHLGTPVLVVLGHTHCGAVTAVSKGEEVHGAIPQLVDNIVPALQAVRQAHPELEGSALVDAVIEANVWQAIADIFTRSPIIAARAAKGEVAVVGALYDLLSGEVRFLGEHPQQAQLVASAPAESHGTPAHGAPAAPAHGAPGADHAATPAPAHANEAPAHAPEGKSGGVGFGSVLLLVVALVGVVILLDKTILRPEA